MKCRRSCCGQKLESSGFTLVELLVAVVIVAILAALVFVMGKRAVASSQSAKCLANLRQLSTVIAADAVETGFYRPVNRHESSGGGGVVNLGNNVDTLIGDLTCNACPAAKFNGTDRNGREIGAYGSNPMVLGYTENGNPPLVRSAQVKRPSEVVMMADSAQFMDDPRSLGYSFRWYGQRVGNPERANEPLNESFVPQGGFWDPEVPTLPFRHNGKANVVFCDGHARSYGSLTEIKERNFYTNY